MNICSLASGSAGNATLISTLSTRILVDCGLSVKQLIARMAAIGESPDDLDAICISHEHSDHIDGLARLVRHGIKRGRAVPVFLTEGAASMIKWENVENPPIKFFKPGTSFVIGDISVSSFTVPHDSSDPVAFCFTAGGSKVGVATDLGFIPDALRARFRDCRAILLESNHDVEMLRNGPHPLAVKIRVAGRYGHLSNLDVVEYLEKDLGSQMRHVILGHLSKENNSVALALEGARDALFRRGLSAKLTIASQDAVTELIEI